MKGLLKITGYIVFVLSVTLIGLEILLRLVLPAPSLSYARQFRQDIPGLTPEFIYDRNEWGLRSLRMKTLAKPPGTMRVIVLGASTTDQATQNTKNTWSGILEQTLTAALGSRYQHVEVAAYGRGGDRVYDTLCWARDNLLEMQPDLVIVLHGVNDMAWNGGPEYSFDPKNPPACGGSLTRFLRHHAEVFRWGVHLKNQWRVRTALAQGGAVEWHSQNLPRIRAEFSSLPAPATLTRVPDPYDEFTSEMTALAQQMVDWKVPVLFLSQPSVWRDDMTDDERARLWFSINTPQGPVRMDPTWMADEMKRYNEFTATFLRTQFPRAHHVSYFDLAAVLAKNTEIFFDDCHFTDAGSRKVAEAVFQIIQECDEEGVPRIVSGHHGE